MLNERLIRNAWDLLRSSPTIVDSADEAGLLAGRMAAQMKEGIKEERWQDRGGGGEFGVVNEK